ncbi:BNR-4 repeat-containing protein [Catenovulum maritimum]|uniref:BNR repeat neuraminidase n=1 Tax=Catenovulum maritimum TaxID=1513271 RepID=A0A0J8GUW0_9ALTE|nr:BNR-4 repeat-containing protein [Catenovulum maritimum]KMT65079.1 hypothetical protein XM47_11480 [Catenovulum maritimum]
MPLNQLKTIIFVSLVSFCCSQLAFAENQTKAVFLSQSKITDQAMFFDGNKVSIKHQANNPAGYDYVYGNALSPHGDCIKVYKDYVFMTWYKGGKENRHVMLTRLNNKTGVMKTIEFPHRHTGYNGKWWIGETHNTIAVGISPKNDSIHMLYDMHRNGRVSEFADDYLRYSYTLKGAATVADEDFNLNLFVNSKAGHYKHLNFTGIDDVKTTKLLTYPAFFTGDNGDLFMKMRYGFSANGKMLFARFDGKQWHGYTDFNRVLASEHGSEYNWGLYGDFKYEGGKFRVAFQRRSKNKNDKYVYQNGIYYAYSDDPTGVISWKDANAKPIELPVAKAELIQIAEPGDWAQTTKKDQVSIVHGFDFVVTDKGDEHFVSQVKDLEFGKEINLHTYRKSGTKNFTTVEYDLSGQLYTSNNAVYLIGLKDSRVNIVKTQGGENKFELMYQHNTGPKFDKGVLFVADGKVYYYLKQAEGIGDTRTLYLQVFDLN